MADTQQRPAGKVVTEHDEANAAIDELRKIAGVLKRVGDEAQGLRGVDDDLRDAKAELDRANELCNELTQVGDDFERLQEAVADFDRGIVDRDELITLSRELSHD